MPFIEKANIQSEASTIHHSVNALQLWGTKWEKKMHHGHRLKNALQASYICYLAKPPQQSISAGGSEYQTKDATRGKRAVECS